MENIKTKVFKTAWKNLKNGNKYAKNLSMALKSAWKFWKEKTAEKVVRFIEIVKESEKAVLVKFDIAKGKNNTQDIWVPKSIIKNNTVPSWFIANLIAEKRI